ncbi:MAG: NAD-dependent epimerase/dehydratase family protein [Gemmatimonadota bacterium]
MITGANGFLGRHLVDLMVDRGWTVRGLVRDLERNPFRHPDVALFLGDIPDVIDERAFENIDVVIHCAYMSRHTTLTEAGRVNEEGSARVLALSRKHGTRFAFVSSTGAHEGAVSYYARSKLAVESTLDLDRDLIIRPGLILGDGGLFKRISESLARFGFVPVFDGGHQMIQTVHVGDLSLAIALALERGLTGRYVVAEPEGLELRDLFALMGERMGRRLTLVPLPASPLLWVLRCAEHLGVPLPLTSENVLGAKSLRTQPSAGDLSKIGLSVRGVSESLDGLIAPGRAVR